MKLQTLLENLLEEELDEAAIPVEQANQERLALMTKGGGTGGACVMLYNPRFALDGLTEAFERNGKEAELGLMLEQALEDSRAIIGYLSYEPIQSGTDSPYYVSLSAADTGYGPLLYDIGLSMIAPRSLTSDRNSVSKAAQRIWQYYFNNRTDVNRQLIAGADDIRQYGKLVPTMSAGGGQLRYVVQDYRYAEQQIRDIEKIEPLRAKLGQEPVDRTEEKEEALSQLRMAAEEYKTGILDNPLAYQYSIKKRLDVSSLVEAHRRFVNYIYKINYSSNLSKSEIDDVLDQAGEKFGRGRIP